MDKKSYSKIQKDDIKKQHLKEFEGYCSICGESDPRVLRKKEDHHTFAKCNGEEKGPICLNCHAKVTYDQNLLSPDKRKDKSKPNLPLLFVSVGSLLEIIGKKLKDIGYDMGEI